MAQVIAGGGVTPWTGFRVGGAIAKGKYRSSSDSEYYGLPPDGYMGTLTDADALVMNLEAEFSYRYTKISGEWVRDRFETNGAPAVSRGFYVQGVQTITPRTFAAARYTYATTPTRALTRSTRESAEVSGGFRLIPALTLRAGYEGSRRFGEDGVGPRGGGVHRLGAALVLNLETTKKPCQFPTPKYQLPKVGSWGLEIGS